MILKEYWKWIYNRFYYDFFAKSRLGDYKNLLKQILKYNYKIISVEEALANKKYYSISKKLVLLRHDVDSDALTALKMAQIENELGIKSSYYFRIKTAKFKIMQSIKSLGHEVGYHFEEISTLIKKHGIESKEEIKEVKVEAKNLFLKNIQYMRSNFPLLSKVVAAHGDFVNRKTNISNLILLKENSFRKASMIDHEVYDKNILKLVNYYTADTFLPNNFNPYRPLDLVRDNASFVLLIHPRSWHTSFKENLSENSSRFADAIYYYYSIQEKNIINFFFKSKFKSYLKISLLCFRKSSYQCNFNNYDELSSKSKDLYTYFTRRRSFFFLKNKELSIACLDLNIFNSFESYLNCFNGKNSAAYQYRKCKKRGYRFSLINPNSYIKDINEINTSKQMRGGYKMDISYQLPVREFEISHDYIYIGILIKNKLVAYAYIAKPGDFYVFDQLLGHGDFLNDGIMYMLFLSFFENQYQTSKSKIPLVTYDTMFNTMSGIFKFKSDLGFQPHRVKWILKK